MKENFVPKMIDIKKTKTFSAWERKNLVTVGNLGNPNKTYTTKFYHPEIDDLIERIVKARKNERPVIWFMGAHVIKCGLSRYVIELIKNGVITHIASNGAGSIHDFELAYLGGTSEYVPRAIEDGSFGMWEETGLWMNEAIQEGFKKHMGYGRSLASYIDNHRERFPYAEFCILYNAYKNRIPATYHVTIGTDIIDQHPIINFAAKGGTSGIDFLYFCYSVSQLEGGVFLNFGSAVTGPEVFLKALSICRNQGYKVENITTANFDIIPLDDYKVDVKDNHFHYYYRPRKNIVNRPVSLGGRGFYIEGNHKDTIPYIYHKVISKIQKG